VSTRNSGAESRADPEGGRVYKANVYVSLKKQVLDPQGKTIQHALHDLGFTSVTSLRYGKFVEVELDSKSREEAAEQLDAICRKLLANPVIEDYRFEIL
jgi:phosphoribosylformylglycinamidine synthase PurS subunit